MRADMNEHASLLRGPDGDSGIVVRLSVLESRVAWAIAIASCAGLAAIGLVLERVFGQ